MEYFLISALLDSYKSWNLVSADYSLAVNRDYLNAVNEVMPVAKKVAKWLTELINDGHASPEKITLIGFSLGAQVAGIAAQALRSLNFTVGKIVGKFEIYSFIPRDPNIND